MQGYFVRSQKAKPMDVTQMLNSLSNQTIGFVTSRREGSGLPTAVRQVLVTGPAEAVEISKLGDLRVLDKLTNLLRDPQRDWAAEVLLASMTGHEEDIVNAFATNPKDWQENLGKDAYKRWSTWLKAHRAGLRWDQQTKTFTERQP